MHEGHACARLDACISLGDGWHKVYCRSCGQELPDWAAFCDRCGAPVRAVGTSEDPIEQVEFVNGLAEPLWDEAEDPHADDDAIIDRDESPDGQAAPSGKTEFMGFDIDEGAYAEGAGGAFARGASLNGATGGGTRRMSIADDETRLISELEGQNEAAAHEEAAKPTDAPAVDDVRDSGQGSESAPDAENLSGKASDEGEVKERGENLNAPAEPDGADADEDDHAEDNEPSHERDSAAEEEDSTPEDDDVTEPSPDEGKADDPHAPYREPLKTIDVGMGMDQNWYEGAPRRPYNRPADHRRAFEYDHVQDPGAPTIWVVIGIAAAAIAISLLVAHIILNSNTSTSTDEEEIVINSKRVSKREADRIIATLDGWWKTDRTFDGRYWHLQSGLMETYAADGKLAAQVLVDPASLERLDNGPGGIEGAGYYLRDVGYYLVDDDPDTLHAIAQDGQADEDANLLRADPPSFVSEGTPEDADSEPADIDDADRSEYMLPDAATRVYDNAELEAMSDHDLFVARNEIYARHGYVFETGELSEYFGSKSWYQPSDVFNEGEISEIERQNVSAILAIEQARGSQYV